jgi:cyanophycinase
VSARSFALLGSGEFEEWSRVVDGWMLERASGDDRVLILPTASAKEGDDVFNMWANKGLDHYSAGGVQAEVLRVKTPEDAHDEGFVQRVSGASAVYFSGGNPAYLAEVLQGSPLWAAIIEGLDRGLVYAGCSAGVACLAERAPDSDARSFDERAWRPGLGVFKNARLMPHWDALDTFVPGLTDMIVSSVPPGGTLVGIDENTAIVGDGSSWEVMGTSKTGVYRDGEWQIHPAGDSFELAF